MVAIVAYPAVLPRHHRSVHPLVIETFQTRLWSTMGKVNRPPPKYKATRKPMPDFRCDKDGIVAKFVGYTQAANNGCLEWTGFKNHLGYGYAYWSRRRWAATRLIYCAHHGPFDPKLDVRHSCDNPSCVNIDHLSLGTRSDNMRDAVDRQRAKNSKKTCCPKGHTYGIEWMPHNGTYRPWRRCKICDRARQRIKLGWPEDLAYSLPPGPVGFRPPEVIQRSGHRG